MRDHETHWHNYRIFRKAMRGKTLEQVRNSAYVYRGGPIAIALSNIIDTFEHPPTTPDRESPPE